MTLPTQIGCQIGRWYGSALDWGLQHWYILIPTMIIFGVLWVKFVGIGDTFRGD